MTSQWQMFRIRLGLLCWSRSMSYKHAIDRLLKEAKGDTKKIEKALTKTKKVVFWSELGAKIGGLPLSLALRDAFKAAIKQHKEPQ